MAPPPDDRSPAPRPSGDALDNAPTADRLEAAPLPDESHRFRPGLLLAERYRVLRFLAQGGMGEIYEVEDLQLGERVALKTVRATVARHPAALERFKREVQLARRVTHPNVCRLFEFGAHTGPDGNKVVFLTMELLSGETLLDKLHRELRLTPDQALPLVQQMVAALEAAHRAGVVHRDFKSANVVLVPRPGSPVRAVVTDFGLAQVAAGEGETSSNTEGVSGTLDYMAPEQIAGNEPTQAVDVYALGMVMYEMLTGRRPFHDTDHELKRRLTEPAPSPRVLLPGLDPAWERLIAGCLERNPANRFRDATEVARALPGRERERSRGRVLRLGAGVVVLALAAVAVYRVAVGPRVEAPSPAPARRTFAVLPFKNLSGQSEMNWVATAVSEMLTSELAAGQRLRAIPGEDVARMRVELQVPETDALARDTLAKIQANLGADLVVSGSYLAGGPELRLDVSVQNARAGETVATIVETGTREELPALVSRAGTQLRQSLGVGELTDAQIGALRASRPVSAEAARLYAAGLARLRAFDTLAGRDLLEKAVAAEPKYPLAHAALAEALSRLGYEETAREEARLAFEQGEGLPREDRLLVEARYREIAREWAKAAEIHRTLLSLFPDDLEHGLRLTQALNAAGRSQEAAQTLAALRTSAAPAAGDPRIDLVEAEVAQSLGDFRREREAAQKAAAKGAARGARLLLARARVFQAYAAGRLGLEPEAMAAATEAKAIYSAAGDRGGAAWALNRIANVLYQQGELAKAEGCYREAEAVSDEIGYRGSLTSLLNNIAEIFFLQGQLERANDTLERARTYAKHSADPRTSIVVRLNMANVAAERGQYARAMEMYAQTLLDCRKLGEKSLEGSVLWHRAVASLHQGDLGAAQRSFADGLEILQRQGNARYAASALTGLGDVRRETGDAKGARQAHEQALALREQMGDKFGRAESRLALARLDLDEGRAESAEAPLREVAAVFSAERASDPEAEADALLARALRAQKRPAPAIESARRAETVAKNSERPHVRILVAVELARARTEEAPLEARRQAEAALAQAAQVGSKGLELEAGLALAEIETAAGLTSRARERLLGLEREARQRGFERLAQAAVESLGKR
jgi:TolB-like protein/Tfp pilus assembly protein PilF